MTQKEEDNTSGFEAARARLTSIAYRMLGSRAEAEDIVQEAWLKWHAAAKSDLDTPLAWLTTVTTRLAIDRIRRLQTEQAARANEYAVQPWDEEFAPSAEDEALHASSVSEAVKLLFERLSSDERAAFVLHEAFDCDYAQIAAVVGKTPAHCRQLAHRARRRLTDASEGGTNGARRDRAAAEPDVADAERLLEIIHRADVAGAMRILAEREVPVATAGGVAAGCGPVAAGALAPAPLADVDSALEVHALSSDHGVALALVHDCEIVGVLRLTFMGRLAFMGACYGYTAATARLTTCGAEVEALNGRFGSRAVKQLLAKIAGARSSAAYCMAA